MPTTPNKAWPTPADTDYVKDGAAAIRALGDAADADVAALDTAVAAKAEQSALDSHTGATAPHSATSLNVGSRLVLRNTNGDIAVRLLRPEFTSTNASPNYFLTQVAVGDATTDNYARPSTIAQVKAALGISGGGTQRATGAYTGDGAATRTIGVGFEPDLVIVTGGDGVWSASNVPHANATYGAAVYGGGASSTEQVVNRPKLASTGFIVGGNSNYHLNKSGLGFQWLALKF